MLDDVVSVLVRLVRGCKNGGELALVLGQTGPKSEQLLYVFKEGNTYCRSARILLMLVASGAAVLYEVPGKRDQWKRGR